MLQTTNQMTFDSLEPFGQFWAQFWETPMAHIHQSIICPQSIFHLPSAPYTRRGANICGFHPQPAATYGARQQLQP